MNTQKVIDTIIAQGILPLYYHADETVSVEILRAVYRAGIKAIEYTNRGDAAINNFKKLVEVRDAEMPGLVIGIGTVKNIEDMNLYLQAGADFFVSPGYVAEIAEYTVANDIFYAPGCMTPSEIIAAENAGIRFIKLFPGDVLGPKYLSNIKPVFPKLYFMPTGGVNTSKESIEAWFKAGVCAVGMGSKLISKQLIENKDYLTIEDMTRQVLQTIQSIKQ